jgi:hypothetical protein
VADEKLEDLVTVRRPGDRPVEVPILFEQAAELAVKLVGRSEEFHGGSERGSTDQALFFW